MQCQACGNPVPSDAEVCPFCRSSEIGAVPPEADPTDEEFIARMLAGNCPACGSSAVSNCAEDPSIRHPSVNRCGNCGQFWCIDCGKLFPRQGAAHPHEDASIGQGMEDFCEIFPGRCSVLLRWRGDKAE